MKAIHPREVSHTNHQNSEASLKLENVSNREAFSTHNRKILSKKSAKDNCIRMSEPSYISNFLYGHSITACIKSRYMRRSGTCSSIETLSSECTRFGIGHISRLAKNQSNSVSITELREQIKTAVSVGDARALRKIIKHSSSDKLQIAIRNSSFVAIYANLIRNNSQFDLAEECYTRKHRSSAHPTLEALISINGPDFFDQNDNTALLELSRHSNLIENNLSIARILIERGADVNRRCRDGKTPLMYAIYNDNEPLVEALLYAGADPTLTDRSGRDAYWIANYDRSDYSIPIAAHFFCALKLQSFQIAIKNILTEYSFLKLFEAESKTELLNHIPLISTRNVSLLAIETHAKDWLIDKPAWQDLRKSLFNESNGLLGGGKSADEIMGLSCFSNLPTDLYLTIGQFRTVGEIVRSSLYFLQTRKG